MLPDVSGWASEQEAGVKEQSKTETPEGKGTGKRQKMVIRGEDRLERRAERREGGEGMRAQVRDDKDGEAPSAESTGSGSGSASCPSENSDSSQSTSMMDGFALYSLAIHEHLRGRLMANCGADKPVTNEMVLSELRKLWKNMAEAQKVEWQSQASMVPPGQLDSSSHEAEDEDSQDSGSGSFASQMSTEQRSNDSEERRSNGSESRRSNNSNDSRHSTGSADRRSGGQGRPSERRRDKHHRQSEGSKAGSSSSEKSTKSSSNRTSTSASSSHGTKSGSELSSANLESLQNTHLQSKRAQAGVDPSLLAGLDRAFSVAAGPQLAGEASHRAPMPTSMPTLSSLQSGLPQGIPHSVGGLASEQLYQLQPSQHLSGLAELSDGVLVGNRLMPISVVGGVTGFPSVQGVQTLPAIQNSAFHTLQNFQSLQNQMQQAKDQISLVTSSPGLSNAHLSSMVLQQGLYAPDQSKPQANHLLQQYAIPQAGQHTLVPITMRVPAAQYHTVSTDSFSIPGTAAVNPGIPATWTVSQTAGLGQAGQVILTPAAQKRPFDAQPSGLKLQPEGPQVRTMTFVCDVFHPYEAQIDLEILSEKVEIIESGNGIVGLSCQLPTGSGSRVVRRGQVKDARRHFAHQAQLRLCLSSSPNISLKVFSTGRLQIAGCRDEKSCIQAVNEVVKALNKIQKKYPNIMKIQPKMGPLKESKPLEQPIDATKLPPPQIVMINCSFDSGMAAVGYALDPHRLTEMLRQMQRSQDSIEDVQYNPEQRYTGVKVKFKPRECGANKGDPPGEVGDREVFIGMFPSGKAVITGAVKWDEVNQSYEFARSVLCDNFDYLKVPIVETGRASRKKPRREGM